MTVEPHYLCHECGTRLEARDGGRKLLWCPRCCKRRRKPQGHKPDHLALIVWERRG